MLATRLPCHKCRKLVGSIEAHFRHSPECDTAPREERPLRSKHKLSVSERETLFRNQYASRLVGDFQELHWNKLNPATAWDQWGRAETNRLGVVEEYLHDELKAGGAEPKLLVLLHSLLDKVKQVSAKYRAKSAVVTYAVSVQRAPYIESTPLDGTMPREESRKDASSLSLQRLLVRQLQWREDVRRASISKSDRWKTGEYHMVLPALLRDLEDGLKARHSWVMEKSTDPSELRVMIQLHVDDVTPVNGLGIKAGKHKYCVTGAANCNLPFSSRFKWDNLLMLQVVNSKVVKDKGMVYLWCGVDKHGMFHFEGSLASEFRQLEEGVVCWLPDDDKPGEEKQWKLRVFLVHVVSDWLANASLGPNAESTGADYPCTWCWWLSFEAQKRGGRRKRLHLTAASRLRTQQTQTRGVEKLRLECKGISKTAVAEKMKAAGLYRLHYAWDNAYFPGVDTVLDRPPDTMHLLGAGGILAHENAMWVKIAFCGAYPLIPDGFSKFNRMVRLLKLPHAQRLPDIRPPPEGKALKEITLDLKAAQNFTFAAFGREIFESILTPEARAHPAWASWCALQELTMYCMRDSYDRVNGPRELTKRIETHRKAFDEVGEYIELERPKHHFMDHLVAALERHGPFRLYWCMPWEGNLSLITRIMNMNNYKSVAGATLDFWSMRSALSLAKLSISFEELNADFTTDALTLDALDEVCKTSHLASECRAEFPHMDGFRIVANFRAGLLTVRPIRTPH